MIPTTLIAVYPEVAMATPRRWASMAIPTDAVGMPPGARPSDLGEILNEKLSIENTFRLFRAVPWVGPQAMNNRSEQGTSRSNPSGKP